MDAGQVDRGDLVTRTDQDWGEGMVLSVHADEARVSWSGGDVVSWVPLALLAFAVWTKEECADIAAEASRLHDELEPLIY